MKLKNLWIEDYNQFKNRRIIFDSEQTEIRFQQEMYGKANITLFSGENGAGKTTILSFIAYIFRYLQRFRERMFCDFELTYELKVDHRITTVRLRLDSKDLYIMVNNKNEYYVQEFNLKKRMYVERIDIPNHQVTYDEIEKFLPANVYVMGFDAVYKSLDYSSNYIGDRRVEYRDIANSYITTNRGAYNSNGILYLYHAFSARPELRKVFKSWGLDLSPFVDVKINIKDEEYPYLLFGNPNNAPFSYDVDYFVSNESKKAMYKNSGIQKYLSPAEEYNVRLNIYEYLKTQKNYNHLKDMIECGVVYINEYYIKKGEVNIPISHMSTGEKAFFSDLFFLAEHVDDNSLVIWEEPETHLNAKWAKNLIPVLMELFKNKDVHWLLSSHSSYMIRNLFPYQIICLRNGIIENPNFNTFMANDVEISRKIFGDMIPNPFESKVLKYAKQSKALQSEMMDVLGESYLRFMVFNLMEE